MQFELNAQEKQILLQTAREVISARLEKRKPLFSKPNENLQQQCGAFVTLHKHGKLRGCIGHITGLSPLIETIKEVAAASAFQDPRFPPLAADEIKDIDIEISVLTPLERITDPGIIEPGKHGIYIKRRGYSGVLLPQVATEQGWDRETFLTHTCYKAGLPGDCWEDPAVEIYT
ncbi:MAG: AmmeMemoRadiSam system protein A, partial [Spirochaetota bacterium]